MTQTHKQNSLKILANLFNLDLKVYDPMDLDVVIKAIMPNIYPTKVNICFHITAFIKAPYPTSSCYLESLQANGKMNSITFDSLVEKNVEHEKYFGKKKITQHIGETMCLNKKGKNQEHDRKKVVNVNMEVRTSKLGVGIVC